MMITRDHSFQNFAIFFAFQPGEKLAYPVFKPSEFQATSYSIRRGRLGKAYNEG